VHKSRECFHIYTTATAAAAARVSVCDGVLDFDAQRNLSKATKLT